MILHCAWLSVSNRRRSGGYDRIEGHVRRCSTRSQIGPLSGCMGYRKVSADYRADLDDSEDQEQH